MGPIPHTSEICVSSVRYFARKFQLSTNLFVQEIYETSSCVSASQSTLDKPVVKLVMPVGNCTALNMASSLMVKCQVTRPLEVVTTLSIPSSVKLVLANMYHELYSWIWNLQLLMRSVLVHTVNSSILNSLSLAKKMLPITTLVVTTQLEKN